jgi:hypothetical protein
MFEYIGMLDLFNIYIETAAACQTRAFGIIVSDYARVDQQEGINYVHGVSQNLSYPLSCITSYIDMDLGAVKSAYSEIIKNC